MDLDVKPFLKSLRLETDQDWLPSLKVIWRKWSLILTKFVLNLIHTWLNHKACSVIHIMIWLLMKNFSCQVWLQHAIQSLSITVTFWMSISSMLVATSAQTHPIRTFLLQFSQESTWLHTVLKPLMAMLLHSSVSSTLLFHQWMQDKQSH